MTPDEAKQIRLTALQDAAKEMRPLCAQVDGHSIHAADKDGQHWYRCQSPNHPDGHVAVCSAKIIHRLIEREGLK